MKRRLLKTAVKGLFTGFCAGAVLTLLGVSLVVRHSGTGMLREVASDAAVYFLVLTVLIVLMGGVSLYLQLRRERDLFAPVSKASRQVAQGDYSVRLPVNGDDEISRLHQTFNDMCRVLTDTVDKLEQQNQRLETILSTMSSGILAVDGDLRITMVNEAAQHLLSVGEEALGLRMADAVRTVRMEDAFIEAMMGKDTLVREVTVYAAAGEVYMRVSVTPILREEGVAGALAVLSDITKVHRLENMQREFIANVSHEMKTPLTSIKGFVETLLMDETGDREMQAHFLHIIEEETNRLTRLIGDILTLSEMESRAAESRPAALNVARVAQGVAELMALQAEDKGIDLQLYVTDETLTVLGEADRLRQLLVNLVDNGIKYTPEGGSVTVTVLREGTDCLITVVDTGIGIEPAHQVKLFERFYRVDKGRSRQMGGTGLGLAIVHSIAQRMGGSIEVESEAGKGTAFTVTLPLTEA